MRCIGHGHSHSVPVSFQLGSSDRPTASARTLWYTATKTPGLRHDTRCPFYRSVENIAFTGNSGVLLGIDADELSLVSLVHHAILWEALHFFSSSGFSIDLPSPLTICSVAKGSFLFCSGGKGLMTSTCDVRSFIRTKGSCRPSSAMVPATSADANRSCVWSTWVGFVE
jgi:hypothetical protein